MASVLATQIITPEQLAAMPNQQDFELVDGQLVERKMGNKASWVAFELASLLREYVRKHRLGWVFCGDTGFRLDPDHPNTVRKPDAGFVRAGRLGSEGPAIAYDHLAPDLAVESVSPNDTASELEEKIEDYLAAGVRLIWVIYPESKTVKVFRSDGTITPLRVCDELSGEDVVPGFQCKISDLFINPA